MNAVFSIKFVDFRDFESGRSDQNSGWVACFEPNRAGLMRIEGKSDDFEFEVREGMNMVKRKFYFDD